MFIAMDMGTSNTRLWLCEEDNVVHSVKARIGAKNFTALENLAKEYVSAVKKA